MFSMMADSVAPKDASPAADGPPVARGRRKHMVRLVVTAAWVLALGWQGYATFRAPSAANVLTLGGFGLLFVITNAQLLLVRWMGHRRLTHALARMHGTAYLSDLDDLPNRNYLLSELRREMPHARTSGSPFVLIVLSLDTFDEVCERRGAEFGDRALKALVQVLRRFTRTSDFIAHLGGQTFAVMLNECKYDDAFIYLQRVPGSVAVSDGHTMYEVPVSARVHQYDMEGLYATDVLRDAEESRPLQRKLHQHFGSEAA